MINYTYYSGEVRTDEIIVGSSDMPVVIKTEKTHIKKSTRELWNEKRNGSDFTGNDATRWGHKLEPLVLHEFIFKNYNEELAYQFLVDTVLHQEYRAENYNPPTIFKPYTEARLANCPWAVAHADCLVVPEDGSEPFLLEAKTGRFFARVARDDMPGFIIEEDESPDIEKIPIEVLIQVQWQLMIYKVNFAYVLLLVDDNVYIQYKIPAIKKWFPIMLEKASVFYNQCITGERPQPEKKEDVFDQFKSIFDKAVFVVGERALMAEKMREEKKRLKKLVKKYKDHINDINDATALLMGDHKFLFNGETSQKLFSQSCYSQDGMFHPSKLDEEDYEKYKKRGLIKENLIRKVN